MAWSPMIATQRTASAPSRPRRYGTVADVQGAQDERINSDLGYDASGALNTYAQGAYATVSDGLRQTLADTRGRSVGAGRFDSGYLDEDQGQVIRQTQGDFSRALAAQAMNAEQLTQDVRGRGTDLLMGRSEQVQNDSREQDARKRQKKRGIFGAIGTVLGAGVGGALGGGPWGASVGGSVGGSIGGSIGGAF